MKNILFGLLIIVSSLSHAQTKDTLKHTKKTYYHENFKLIPMKYFDERTYSERERDLLLTIPDLDKELLDKRLKELDFIIKINKAKIYYYLYTPKDSIKEFENTRNLPKMP